MEENEEKKPLLTIARLFNDDTKDVVVKVAQKDAWMFIEAYTRHCDKPVVIKDEIWDAKEYFAAKGVENAMLENGVDTKIYIVTVT